MKKILAVVFCLILVLCAAAPVAAQSSTSGVDYEQFKDKGISINVYNWGEYISDGSDDSMDVNAAFEERTGIKVYYSTYSSNEELYAKLKSGGTSYDVIIPSDYMIARMDKEGMLQKLDYSLIPNYSLINDQFKGLEYDPDQYYSVPYMWGTVGIIYNKTMVTDPVDSWNILWNAKYKGSILMFSNPRDAFGIAQKKLGYSFNTTDEAQLKAAAEELKAQKPLVQAYVMDEIFDKMEGGEAALAPYYAGDAITMIKENSNLAFAVPKEGTNRFVDAMCVPVGSQNKEAAQLYINFMCETETALANCQYIGYSTPQKDAYGELDDDIKNNEIAYPSDEVLAKTEVYTNLPDSTNELVSGLWAQIISENAGFGNWIVPIVLVVLAGATVGIMIVRKKKKDSEEL